MTECSRKDKCDNYPEKCGMCGAMADVYTHYPMFLKKDYIIRHLPLKKPEVQYDFSQDQDSFVGVAKLMGDFMAKVVDYQNKVLCDAIIQYATEQGYTDLFLIDEEFVRSAIVHEIERRANDEQED